MVKLDVHVEAKSPADKLWATMRQTTTLYPLIFPDRCKSVDVLEGDGESVGSVVRINLQEGGPVTFSKEKFIAVDEVNKFVSYQVLDGELSHVYKNFVVSVQVVPNGDGSLVNWSGEYEKARENDTDPTLIKELAANTIKGLDEYTQMVQRLSSS